MWLVSARTQGVDAEHRVEPTRGEARLFLVSHGSPGGTRVCSRLVIYKRRGRFYIVALIMARILACT